jgi:signal transduction histidine kinase
LRDFFEQNESIIAFAHGVVFFALGFAVWVQRRRVTRLALTSSLIWLASFAFVESIAIWGYAFVPIQAKYLNAGFVDVLIIIRSVIQVAAFLFLLEFGLRLSPLRPRLRGVISAAASLGVLVALAIFALVADARGWTTEEWASSSVAVCRYAVLFPGGLLAAVGMWRQGSALVAAGMRRIRPYADAAAWVLVAYAVTAGLIVDNAPWAPTGLANEERWLALAGFPLRAIRAVLGLALCALAIKLLEIFEVDTQQRIAGLERARLVAEERARFGRDLHDGTIQSIYAAGLQLESVAMRSVDQDVRRGVRDVVGQLNTAITGLRGYINALHASPSNPQGVVDTLELVAQSFSRETGLAVDFRAVGVSEAGMLPDETGHHAEQILREALSNAARHSGSTSANVLLTFTADEFDLMVEDRGLGVGPDDERDDGRGLRNMRERARRLGGRVTIAPRPGGGTSVVLAVPLDGEPEQVTMQGAGIAPLQVAARRRDLETPR